MITNNNPLHKMSHPRKAYLTGTSLQDYTCIQSLYSKLRKNSIRTLTRRQPITCPASRSRTKNVSRPDALPSDANPLGTWGKFCPIGWLESPSHISSNRTFRLSQESYQELRLPWQVHRLTAIRSLYRMRIHVRYYRLQGNNWNHRSYLVPGLLP